VKVRPWCGWSRAGVAAAPWLGFVPACGRAVRQWCGLPVTPAHLGMRIRQLARCWGLDLRVAQCCFEQCDMRSHVLSEYVVGGIGEIDGVVRVSVEARPCP